MTVYPQGLQPSLTSGAALSEINAGVWRFWLPPGGADHYRVAQLDDYGSLPRRGFLHQPETMLSLRARASAADIPGTWGFGLWNDPFSMGLLTGNGLLRLPALPSTAWFFFASPPNYLSLRDDLPAQGGLAATFRSPAWANALLPFSVLALPLLALPAAVRGLRRMARPLVRQAAVQLDLDPTDWHTYRLEWEAEQVRFYLDGAMILETQVTPCGRLGLVIWIDNQYLTLGADGRFRYGFLASPEPVWIEVGDLTLSQA